MMMMIEKVISGGQTGADQAAWRAAKALGIPTGGHMPLGFMTEDGPRPEFAEMYGAQELSSPEYWRRTRRNVCQSDMTIVFDASGGRTLDTLSRGSQLAIRIAMEQDFPSLVVAVELGIPVDPKRAAATADWIRNTTAPVWIHNRRLNVGGNRESKAPGIGAWVEEYLREVFRLLLSAEPTAEQTGDESI